jgi:erythrocyte band 7 integral membrane protein
LSFIRTTMSTQVPTDSKAYRHSSPSVSSGNSNVVDHHAPDVTSTTPPNGRRAPPAGTGNLITVEPLRKAEMQTSYAHDLGLGNVEHGLYGTLINGASRSVENRVEANVLVTQAWDVSLGCSELFLAARAPTRSKRFSKAPSASLLDSGNSIKVNLPALLINFVLILSLAVDPGLVQVNVCSEELRRVDVKIQIASIGRQTVITRDNVNVEM